MYKNNFTILFFFFVNIKTNNERYIIYKNKKNVFKQRINLSIVKNFLFLNIY